MKKARVFKRRDSLLLCSLVDPPRYAGEGRERREMTEGGGSEKKEEVEG